MSRWFWCGVFVACLGLSAAALKFCWRPARPAAVASNPRESEPSVALEMPPAPEHPPIRPTVPSTADLEALEALAALQEPIRTRIEPLEAPIDATAKLPTTGGAEESEVAATQAPRPDAETRRMPYADDSTIPLERRSPSALSWRGLMRWALGVRQRELSGAEESDEPPLLDRALPEFHHPPHCPFGGFCPFPSNYRIMPPR